jgi:hypothetical protein
MLDGTWQCARNSMAISIIRTREKSEFWGVALDNGLDGNFFKLGRKSGIKKAILQKRNHTNGDSFILSLE